MMKKELDKGKKVVLYGSGEKSHNIYRVLCMSGYSVAYCVISNDFVEELDFEDIKVHSFVKKKDEIIERKYQIVIAAGVNYEADIIKYLLSNGIKEFWKRSDMPWNIDFKHYMNLDSIGYLDIIRRKYLSNLEKYGSNKEIKTFIENRKLKADKNKIMFLLVHVSPRAYKIIDALHRKGYIVDVLIWVNAMGMTEETYCEYSDISDQCRLSNDFEEVMLYCAATDAKILHIFSHADTDLDLSQSLINCKSIFPKIVFDEYDVYVGMRNHISQKTIDAELFCLKNADGLCNRYTCMEYLEEKGHSICEKRIYFIDCCYDDTNCETVQKAETDDLSLVYLGTISTDKAYETGKITKLLELGEICRDNEAHLHIYPRSYDRARLHAYIDMEKVNPYFHIHRSISPTKLAREICQYDYGITGAQQGFLEYENEEGVFKKEMWLYCAANKLFDYLDAGLPIISAIPVGQAKILESEGVLIRKVDEEIDFNELRKKRNEMKKRVIEVREKYRISNQLPSLIEFYDSL